MCETCSKHELILNTFLVQVVKFRLFTITYWLFYLLYRFPPIFIIIFNINLKFCERQIDICVVTFWWEKGREWNYQFYLINFICNYPKKLHWEHSVNQCYIYPLLWVRYIYTPCFGRGIYIYPLLWVRYIYTPCFGWDI